MERLMVTEVSGRWGLLLFRGIVAIAFGILTLFWPALSLAVLVGFFAAFALLDGIGALMMASRWRSHRRVWLLVLYGIAGIAASVLAILYPGITTVALLIVIASWAIVTGVSAIVAANSVGGVAEPALLVAGMLSLLIGVLLLIQPFAGALALAWMIGLYAIVTGTTYITFAVRARRAARMAHA
jgi:uncharacterized membrane protein HdeD (DUF308 family)